MNTIHVVIIDHPDRFDFRIESSAEVDLEQIVQHVASHVALRLQTKSNHETVMAKVRENMASAPQEAITK